MLPYLNHITMCPGAWRTSIRLFRSTLLYCSNNMSIVKPQHSTATLPPGCLLLMLPKCLKTDGEGNSQTQTVKLSDSVSRLKAYIIYRSLAWALSMNHKVNPCICLAVSNRHFWCKVFWSCKLNIYLMPSQFNTNSKLKQLMLHLNFNECE